MEETGKLLKLLQGVEGKGKSFKAPADKPCKSKKYLTITLMFVVCRSFDELEAEMLQGQKLQVYIKHYKQITEMCYYSDLYIDYICTRSCDGFQTYLCYF